MEALGSFDPLWFAVALLALIPGSFLSIGRFCLDGHSRKVILELAGPGRRRAIEDALNQRDEFAVTLESGVSLVRILVTAALVFGRCSVIPAEIGTGMLLLHFLSVALEVVVILFLGLRLVPAVVARVCAEAWLLRFLPLIRRLHAGFDPPRRLLASVVRILGLLFGARADRTNADTVTEEILEAVGEGQREGLLETRDIHMIESIISYGAMEVEDVMTPRTDMVVLDLDRPLEENLEKVIECGHSRIPVHRGGKDRIFGVLYVKDLQKYWLRREEISLEQIVREPYIVGPHRKISEILQEFKRDRVHLAIVQDEHRGTAGLVTIEDVLEEIVGEISDEYEEETPAVRKIHAGLVEVEASLHIDDLNEELGLALPESDTYDTIGGLLYHGLGRIPKVGDAHEANGARFVVTEADDRRVHRIRVHLPSSSSLAPPPPSPAGGVGDADTARS